MVDLQKVLKPCNVRSVEIKAELLLFRADAGKECLFPAQKSNYILQQSFDSPVHGGETIQRIRQGLGQPSHYTDK